MKSFLAQLGSVRRRVALFLLAVGLGVGLLSALPATEVMHALSSNEFCASCHTMKPMAETFKLSVHGGNNSQGFVAECVDCHLPESNIVEELYVKGTSGMRHMWGEYVLGMEELDYQALHDTRTDYVFDSGCESCHKALEQRAMVATELSPVSDQTHSFVFARKDTDPDFQCSSCHYDIAHPDLKRNMRLKRETKLQDIAQLSGGTK
ncbi:NapC/NirT family cytochrome c [Photobacterium sp. SDRW27]|uniref:cytochrome c3 family protein n=1 Tax=Photobacterium obscurum TaxID=2829490 RepID=UPI00224340FF|nr:NapC/NirT family cytochrome c [Photobacterium obscurum]MCW8328379.1 NapC/NirT family cytochrome c [Photobacterium obscurum]